jgi:hypothetical protein
MKEIPLSEAVMSIAVIANRVIEISFQASQPHTDPFNELEVDVVFNGPGGEQRVPAFWGGGALWRARFSTHLPGSYRYTSVCSDVQDAGLHGQSGILDVLPVPEGETNRFWVHGAVQVSSDRSGFEHLDKTPFTWLGDTWWMAFCGRMSWPEEFQSLTSDRVGKGFSVVHLVGGLYPDVPPEDQRGWNAGGPAWEQGFPRINPTFFDLADLKFQHLVARGILPMIVGAWGYYLPVIGLEKMKRHWRYLIARWGAYPVAWCLAGEVSMPYYLADDRAQAERSQRSGWSEIARYIRSIDPSQRPLTAHSCAMSDSVRELDDFTPLDFNFVQTGHGNLNTAIQAARHFSQVVQTTQLRPVVNGETCYEGILGTAWQDVQRFCFWTSMLSGAAGYSYGANGIWQVNRAGAPFGPSPHGMAWGNMPWDTAMRLAGSEQIGLSKGLLDGLSVNYLDPHPEWVEPHAGGEDWFQPYCAGTDTLRIIYFPSPLAPWVQPKPRLIRMEIGAKYTAFFFDPSTGMRQNLGEFKSLPDGSFPIPQPNLGTDLVLVVSKV